MEKVLLLIDADILRALRLICCNIVKEGKKAVAKLYILAGLCPVRCAFIEKERGEPCCEKQRGKNKQNAGGMVDPHNGRIRPDGL